MTKYLFLGPMHPIFSRLISVLIEVRTIPASTFHENGFKSTPLIQIHWLSHHAGFSLACFEIWSSNATSQFSMHGAVFLI